MYLSQGSSLLDRSGVELQSGGTTSWYSGIPYKCGSAANLYIIGSKDYLDNCSLTSTAYLSINTSGQLGLNTNAPTADISFGVADRTINIINQTTADTAGN